MYPNLDEGVVVCGTYRHPHESTKPAILVPMWEISSCSQGDAPPTKRLEWFWCGEAWRGAKGRLLMTTICTTNEETHCFETVSRGGIRVYMSCIPLKAGSLQTATTRTLLKVKHDGQVGLPSCHPRHCLEFHTKERFRTSYGRDVLLYMVMGSKLVVFALRQKGPAISKTKTYINLINCKFSLGVTEG